MEVFGYIAAIFIGLVLGLIGGGGSILTVPVLVYLFSVDTTLAIAYSFFVVGITSLVGSYSYYKKKQVDSKVAIIFGIPSVLTIFLTRSFLLPFIPQEIITIGSFELSKDIFLLLLFAVLMIWASWSMLRKKKNAVESKELHFSYFKVIIQGISVGLITGLTGAGGGFLIIPVLVNLLKLPIKTAIGTSLVIISFNSLLGFLFSISQISVQWEFILTITGIAVIGIVIGGYLSTKIDGAKLKPAFGWFVLVMGIYIILKETVFK